MAMEDAVVLARCLQNGSPIEAAFRRYEQTRRERASAVQAMASRNPVLGGNDMSWIYRYDAWTTTLADPGGIAA
jgi:2-polyprenyl-6-methoxyphenol hydroxylase-like FAD-dependent oxidoreductase